MPKLSVTALRRAFAEHWPSYAAEAMGVALFVIASCGTAVVFHHPDSPVRQFLGESKLLRRVVQAFVICPVLIFINFNRAGKRSGSHINPAVTLAFRYLGKISAADAFWYIFFQCGSAVIMGWVMFQLLKTWYAHADVNYNLNTPKPEVGGWPVALLAEFIISAILMLVTLVTLHNERIRKHNSWFNIALIMLYIIFETPFSGMSTNPARSLSTAAGAGAFTDYWIYVLAPLSAMLLVTYLFRRYWKPVIEQPDKPNPTMGWFTTDTIPPDFPIADPDK